MPNTMSLYTDLSFGCEKEENIINLLREYFHSNNIEKMKDKYCIYDAEDISTSTRYEIKARRHKFATYPSTIISYKKRNGATKGTKLLFVFGFTDGLYYIKYDEELFNTFETKNISYHRFGCAAKPVLHYCIPNEYLLPIIL